MCDKICPAGFKCPYGTVKPIPCGPGEYANYYSSKCSVCEPGFYCPTTSVRIACPDGTYSEGNATACKGCEAGYYCQNNVRIPCMAGDY